METPEAGACLEHISSERTERACVITAANEVIEITENLLEHYRLL